MKELSNAEFWELTFWFVTFLILGVMLWKVRDPQRQLPRVPILLLAGFFLLSHLFFDSMEDYLDLAPPRTLNNDFLLRVSGEIAETLVFLILILFSLKVRRAQQTIAKQSAELAESGLQLKRANRLAQVGKLAASVAHEINNPVGIILARTEYILSSLQDVPSELREDLQVVRSQAQRVSSTLREMLSFARPSQLDLQETDIGKVVDDAVSLEMPRCQGAHVTVEQSKQENVPPIQADPDRLQQVLLNLMNNAIDAMSGGGLLRVTTSTAGKKHVVVRVSDSGRGIPLENQKKLFEPFFTTKPAGKGTGLGLAVTYGIVREHGGDILVESAPGKGSTFSVILPIEQKNNGSRPNSYR